MADGPPDIDLSRVVAATAIQQAVWLDSVDSTNNAALAWQQQGDRPCLFLTDEQTQGRGRSGAEWWSGPGALTFSLLTDKPSPVDGPQLSLAVGLGVCRAVGQFLPDTAVQVKWPNDVYVDGKKVAGILIEARADRAVIGIGLNVNNSLRNAPPELAANATSLADVGGGTVQSSLDREQVLIACLHEVFSSIDQWHRQPDRMLEQLRDVCLLKGRIVGIDTPAGTICGVCQGIADDGALLVETRETVHACYSGTVAHFD